MSELRKQREKSVNEVSQLPAHINEHILGYLRPHHNVQITGAAEPANTAMFDPFFNSATFYFRALEARHPNPPVIPPPHPMTYDSCNPMAIGGMVKKRHKKNLFMK